MRHRHIEPQGLTLAAIDDIIARGAMADWLVLRDRVRGDAAFAKRVVDLARAAMEDDRDLRRRFWADYAARYAA